MTSTIEQLAPGCFGAASVYSMDSDVCKACVSFAGCGNKAIDNLQLIRQQVDVSDILKRHQAALARNRNASATATPKSAPIKISHIAVAQPNPITRPIERTTASERVSFDLSEEDRNVIATIAIANKKTAAQALILAKANKIEAMRSLLPKGENPFDNSGPNYMRVACDMVIGGGFSRAELKLELMSKLGWGDGTAATHVSMISAMLFAFAITRQDLRGRFILNPALGHENTHNNLKDAP